MNNLQFIYIWLDLGIMKVVDLCTHYNRLPDSFHHHQ